MDRYALLVDAGYLYAGTGRLIAGTTVRGALAVHHQGVLKALIAKTGELCPESLLRVYWYDAAKDANPTEEHKRIESLDNVKVRLGRLTRGGQKGVDSRIVRDLMTLARERAVTSAFLLSGDEDLREGVADAQDAGVRVVLLGIPSSDKYGNQAQTLIREADEHVVLEPEFWTGHIGVREDLIEVTLEDGLLSRHSEREVAEHIGRGFGQQWVDRVNAEEVYVMHDEHQLPRDLDRDLLICAIRCLKTPKIAERDALRSGFLSAVADAVALFDAQEAEIVGD